MTRLIDDPDRTREETVLRWGAGVLVGFLVVGGFLVVAGLLIDGSDAASPASPASRRASSTSASALPTTAITSAAPSPSASASTAPAMTAEQMTGFLRRYLATAPDDPARSWRLLTPAFQRASGSLGAYSGFWAPIESARATGVFADPTARRITYRVRYRYPDGHTFVDSTRLELRTVRSGGLRIAGEG